EMNEQSAMEDENGSRPVERRQDLPQLQRFAVPANHPAVAQSLFDRKIDPPMFGDYAKVRSVKAAAEILAIHPEELAGDAKTPRVLLARQQFGAGFSAVLATDLLWRWKMSLPSTSRAPEKFWQQLMFSLAPPGGGGLRLVKASPSAALHHAFSVRVEGAAKSAAPTLSVMSPDGAQHTLALGESADAESDRWQTSFTPDQPGRWRLQARDATGGEAHITVSVDAQPRTAETSNLPPDIDGLRQLAQATGGALIETEPVFHPPSPTAAIPEMKRTHPLWNSPWGMAVLLGLYGIELILRRSLKLL
ncbi:MAG: hypothetical protein QOD99_718, partial [Chthoniobacter sp.]|nr:hypothetical protein [Chthoniobacter sp.]